MNIDIGTIAKGQAIIYAIVGVVVLIVLFSVLRKFGLLSFKSSVEKKEEKEEEKNTYNFKKSELFNPNSWRRADPIMELPNTQAEKLAKQIYDAIGYVWDDEPQIYAAFRVLPYKINVSQLSDVYQRKYKQDLQGHLLNNLNAEELATIWSIINQKK